VRGHTPAVAAHEQTVIGLGAVWIGTWSCSCGGAGVLEHGLGSEEEALKAAGTAAELAHTSATGGVS